jgi:hypothetical protein
MNDNLNGFYIRIRFEKDELDAIPQERLKQLLGRLAGMDNWMAASAVMMIQDYQEIRRKEMAISIENTMKHYYGDEL